MSVSLQKGQKVDLTKNNSGLNKIVVGLGWDEVKKSGGKGLFGSLFGSGAADIDCDASALLCVDGKVQSNKDVVYFGNLKHNSNSVTHLGDNLTGAGDGDDEQIIVNLSDVPANYDKIIFTVNIFKAKSRNQNFGMIENAFIRIVDASTNTELLQYKLSEKYDGMTAMIFGEVYRYQNEWKFNAIGQATNDDDLASLVKRYQ